MSTSIYPSLIPLTAIDRLHCPECCARMELAQTSAGPTGFELRTFRCTQCDHVEKIAIALESRGTGAVGWFVGGAFGEIRLLQLPTSLIGGTERMTGRSRTGSGEGFCHE
jgi:hypothetical protein